MFNIYKYLDRYCQLLSSSDHLFVVISQTSLRIYTDRTSRYSVPCQHPVCTCMIRTVIDLKYNSQRSARRPAVSGILSLSGSEKFWDCGFRRHSSSCLDGADILGFSSLDMYPLRPLPQLQYLISGLPLEWHPESMRKGEENPEYSTSLVQNWSITTGCVKSGWPELTEGYWYLRKKLVGGGGGVTVTDS